MAQKTRKDTDLRKGDRDTAREIVLYNPVPAQGDAVRVAMTYPASYSIAMSSLGYMILYRQLDENPDVNAYRVTMDTLEDYNPAEFELMGFSFAFELDVVAILKVYDTYEIPYFATERKRHHPLIFAGGPVPITNPEPFADFFDFFIIGEGEEVMRELVDTYRKYRHVESREQLLRHLAAEVPGVYVPSLYHVEYDSTDGPITAITPKYPDVPALVSKRLVADMDNFVASSPIISDKAIFADKFLLEVMRGCAHRCRFCMASYSTLPARGASIQPILDALETGLQHTHKVGLIGALIANHPNFDELCDFINHQVSLNPDLDVSPASLRVDRMTPQIARTFANANQRNLTLAIETGSQRLSRRINKNLTTDEILHAASMVREGGIQSLKFYGMVGLPDETDADILETIELLRTVKKQNPGMEIIYGCSSFVPKGGTPFQWAPKLDNKTIEARFKLLKKGLMKVGDLRASSPKWDYFQAFLSRGDRRLSKLLVRFYQHGGSLGHVNRALKELREEGQMDFPDLDWYAMRERPESEILPWDMITLGIPRDILYKESLAPAGTTNVLTPV